MSLVWRVRARVCAYVYIGLGTDVDVKNERDNIECKLNASCLLSVSVCDMRCYACTCDVVTYYIFRC